MDKIKVLIKESEVQSKIAELAKRISSDYAEREIYLICILKGAVFFACELAKGITVPVTLDFMQVSSYGNSTVHGDSLKIKKDIDGDITCKHVLIAEDIVDTGNTLCRLIPMLERSRPASIEVCTLLDKPSRKEADILPKYSCFSVPDEFIVGWGLDYAQKYRNLPYIGAVVFDEETGE